MLPNNAIVQHVFMGKDGILETVQEGALLIDSSTVDPSVSQAVAAAAAGIYGLHNILIVNIFIQL
jgi:3-hydroxyisobutyrate dehydrogenase